VSPTDSNLEQTVHERYSDAAKAPADKLCCPVEYDSRLLEVIPEEIIERDYGCGDPSRFLRSGETVLDLGSGGGKLCYIASQVVGSEGRVIGVDFNDEMLSLAEKYKEQIGVQLGYHNVTFHKARIQDLALDYRKLEAYLSRWPVRSVEDRERLVAWEAHQRVHEPLIASESVDVIISNCVLNLVRHEDKRRLFEEMFRVLERRGRVVVSDIVSDEDVPARLQSDPELWSGCISGAFREDLLLEAFDSAGFHGMRILRRDAEPWRVIEGIEFRSMTVEAFKGKQGPCLECNHAVVYRGPWRSVTDDDGHTLIRGQRMAVCEKTFGIYTRAPYAPEIDPVPAYREISIESAQEFDCSRDQLRHPRETKGRDYKVTRESDETGCDPGSDCC
jgi:ubiquinone/menaquinone biosynthesis C-methylase UbiE